MSLRLSRGLLTTRLFVCSTTARVSPSSCMRAFTTAIKSSLPTPLRNYVNFVNFPPATSARRHHNDDDEASIASRMKEMGIQLYVDCISPEQHDTLMKELEAILTGKRYQVTHWDSVIRGYREIERPLQVLTPPSRAAILSIFKRFYPKQCLDFSSSTTSVSANVVSSTQHKWPQPGRLQPFFHILDLQPEGHIGAHVDSVRFGGGLLSGLSLGSPSVMVLRRSHDGEEALGRNPYSNDASPTTAATSTSESDPSSKDRHAPTKTFNEQDPRVELYLPPRSLYVLT